MPPRKPRRQVCLRLVRFTLPRRAIRSLLRRRSSTSRGTVSSPGSLPLPAGQKAVVCTRTFLLNQLRMANIAKWRIGGISRAIPRTSEITPGSSSSIPATRISAPSPMVRVGTTPCRSSFCTRKIACNPCHLAIQAPTIPAPSTSSIVGRIPNVDPSFTRIHSSRTMSPRNVKGMAKSGMT